MKKKLNFCYGNAALAGDNAASCWLSIAGSGCPVEPFYRTRQAQPPTRADPRAPRSSLARHPRLAIHETLLAPPAQTTQNLFNVIACSFIRARFTLTNRAPLKIKLLINHAGKGVRPQNQGRFLCLKIVPHFLCDSFIIHNAKLISQNMLLFKTNAAPPPMRRQSRARRVHNAGRRRARRARPQLRTSINKLTQFQHLKKC